jgi:hypothetical protein
MPRTLYQIAADIYHNWPRASIFALPYIHAMRHLNTMNDTYGQDSALTIVLYFLSNASTWRGAEARRIKGELKDLVRSTGYDF